MRDNQTASRIVRYASGPCSPGTAASSSPSSTSSTPRPSGSPRSMKPSPASSSTTGLTPPTLGDITTINWHGVEPVDILCGGFPCLNVKGIVRHGRHAFAIDLGATAPSSCDNAFDDVHGVVKCAEVINCTRVEGVFKPALF